MKAPPNPGRRLLHWASTPGFGDIADIVLWSKSLPRRRRFIELIDRSKRSVNKLGLKVRPFHPHA